MERGEPLSAPLAREEHHARHHGLHGVHGAQRTLPQAYVVPSTAQGKPVHRDDQGFFVKPAPSLLLRELLYKIPSFPRMQIGLIQLLVYSSFGLFRSTAGVKLVSEIQLCFFLDFESIVVGFGTHLHTLASCQTPS